MRKSPRDRRLNADFQAIEQLQVDSSIFSYSASGNPPQAYRLAFHGRGFRLNSAGQVVETDYHEVVVELGAAYPRLVPSLAWQTPIFHPNISHNGVVCLGGYGTHWVPSLTLSEMCLMLWDMIRYKNFDTESPYNREAAAWAKQQNEFRFPVDDRPLRDRIRIEQYPSGSIYAATNAFGNQPVSPEVEIIETGIEIVEPEIQFVTDGDAYPTRESDILFIE